jgi:hypothetical protein
MRITGTNPGWLVSRNCYHPAVGNSICWVVILCLSLVPIAFGNIPEQKAPGSEDVKKKPLSGGRLPNGGQSKFRQPSRHQSCNPIAPPQTGETQRLSSLWHFSMTPGPACPRIPSKPSNGANEPQTQG